MAGFQSFNRNSRLNNLALLNKLPGLSSPAPITQNVSGNTYRATYTSPGTFELLTQSTYNPSKVKEKWGGLRFYVYGGDEYIQGAISLAESLSHLICKIHSDYFL